MAFSSTGSVLDQTRRADHLWTQKVDPADDPVEGPYTLTWFEYIHEIVNTKPTNVLRP
jgi:hypothetical protein